MTPDETTAYLDAIDDAREAMRQYIVKRGISLAGVIVSGLWILGVTVLGATSVVLRWFGGIDLGGAIAGLEILGIVGICCSSAALATVTGEKRYTQLRKAIRAAEREFQRKAL